MLTPARRSYSFARLGNRKTKRSLSWGGHAPDLDMCRYLHYQEISRLPISFIAVTLRWFLFNLKRSSPYTSPSSIERFVAVARSIRKVSAICWLSLRIPFSKLNLWTEGYMDSRFVWHMPTDWSSRSRPSSLFHVCLPRMRSQGIDKPEEDVELRV